jgi:hypothetical protein
MTLVFGLIFAWFNDAEDVHVDGMILCLGTAATDVPFIHLQEDM